MPDYDTLIHMLERSGIQHRTGWERYGTPVEDKIVKWVVIPNKTDGKEFKTKIKFNLGGGLISVETLTD